MKLRKYCAGLALMFAMGGANATLTFNIVQSGPDVVITGSGSADTTGATLSVQPVACNGLNGAIWDTTICVGNGQAGHVYPNSLTPNLTGLTNGQTTVATSSTGPAAFVSGPSLYMPAGYISGSPLSNTSTFSGETFATMGLTDGTIRTLTLPSGDTVVFNVGSAVPAALPATPASIPTLSEYSLMAMASLVAIFGIAAVRRKRTGH